MLLAAAAAAILSFSTNTEAFRQRATGTIEGGDPNALSAQIRPSRLKFGPRKKISEGAEIIKRTAGM
jgi:hypothetical protein